MVVNNNIEEEIKLKDVNNKVDNKVKIDKKTTFKHFFVSSFLSYLS